MENETKGDVWSGTGSIGVDQHSPSIRFISIESKAATRSLRDYQRSRKMMPVKGRSRSHKPNYPVPRGNTSRRMVGYRIRRDGAAYIPTEEKQEYMVMSRRDLEVIEVEVENLAAEASMIIHEGG